MSEFLVANGDENLYLYLESIETIETIPDAFFNPLYEKLKMFFVTGGMPESVSAWTKRRDIEAVQQVLSAIIGAYERDFAKYPDANEFPKISLLWNSIPSQLARENKKFLYSTLKSGARAREYEYALQWLYDSGLVHKVYRCLKPELPLSAYDDLGAFKVYLPDVGLLRRLSLLAPTAFSEGNRLFEEFKGALTENYVLQALRNQYEVPLRYWKDDSRNEVDFILQRENDVLPIEVKSKNSVTSVSLKRYANNYPKETPLRLRFSLNNLHKDNDMLNIPLFMADQADRFIGIALESV
jgi:predicted AAA+ superfamily ATPase